MKPRVTGDTCQCGRPVHEIKAMRLCPCGVHPAYCCCHPIGLVTPKPGSSHLFENPEGTARLIEDVRRHW